MPAIFPRLPAVLPAFALLPVLLLGGCLDMRTPVTEAVSAQAPTLPRAHPGYVQWLRRQSLLEQAQAYAAQVSGTPRQWARPADAARISRLLAAAGVWLRLASSSLETDGSALSALAGTQTLSMLRGMGVEGLLLSPLAESGGQWHERPTDGRDEISFAPAPGTGTDKELDRLTTAAERAGILTGGSLLPLATGFGPDFFLAARHAPEFTGLYVMLEVPPAFRAPLPPAQEPLALATLTPAQMQQWHGAGLLPPEDSADGRCGWAVTGPFTGVDGNERRWLYRWQDSPLRPVLHWSDPSRRAAAIFSAAIIRHTGFRRQTLAMFDAAPLFSSRQAMQDFASSEAAAFCNTVARENRNCGGWTLLDTDVPPALLPAVLAAGTDFVRDSAATPAAVVALLTGDTAPLRAALEAQLQAGTDQRRLARILPGAEGMTLPLSPAVLRDGLPGLAAWQHYGLFSNGRLHATGATLAALAAGLSPAEAPRPAALAGILRRHTLLTAFCAGLPGLLVPQGADIRGALNVAGIASPHAPGLSASRRWRWEGAAADAALPAARLCYPSISHQRSDPASYASVLGRLGTLRRQYGIAEATVECLPDAPPGCIAVLLCLPDGRHLLNAANFTPESRTLPLTPTTGSAVLFGRHAALTDNSGHAALHLHAHECVMVLMESRKSATVSATVANPSQRRP